MPVCLRGRDAPALLSVGARPYPSCAHDSIIIIIIIII